MDENERTRPATKGDLQDLEERLKRDAQDREERFKRDAQEREERLTEALRGMQTEILKAFYSFAESNQRRLTDTEGEAAALKDRLGLVESRLTAVEKRLNMPPAA
jgi:hypothetical protein